MCSIKNNCPCSKACNICDKAFFTKGFFILPSNAGCITFHSLAFFLYRLNLKTDKRASIIFAIATLMAIANTLIFTILACSNHSGKATKKQFHVNPDALRKAQSSSAVKCKSTILFQPLHYKADMSKQIVSREATLQCA